MTVELNGRLILHAPNVHQGGGKSLLIYLLEAIPSNIQTLAQLDWRFPTPISCNRNIGARLVKASILQRIKAELWLKKNATVNDVVICFGNLPPLFSLPCQVTVFIQNRYLVDTVTLSRFPIRTRFRLMAERFWLSNKLLNADEYVVQTPSMKRLLELLTTKPVYILPFVAQRAGYERVAPAKYVKEILQSQFLYVASGEPHKNHRNLIEAWRLLSEQGIHPTLILTLDRSQSADLCSWLEQMIARYDLKIDNVGRLSHEAALELYRSSGALIYPSTLESFGMPLVEARQADLPILAPELDYIRDVVDPEQTFDPTSPVSIARAVKRYLGHIEAPLPLHDAADFLQHVLRANADGHNEAGTVSTGYDLT